MVSPAATSIVAPARSSSVTSFFVTIVAVLIRKTDLAAIRGQLYPNYCFSQLVNRLTTQPGGNIAYDALLSMLQGFSNL